MAKTWTVREAYEAIKANDSSAIADFGKRFPLATAALARSGQNDGLNVLFGALPDRVTMRIIEMSLKEGVTPVEDDENDEEVAEKPVEKKSKKVEKQTAEKAEAPKKGKGGRPKKAEKAVEVEEDAEVEEVAEETAQDYSKMGAVELFKLCKKRGIKVEPKQKASVYVKALEAADKADAEDADDDWSDDAEEEAKPAKKSGKAAKATKKSDEDDDDMWDI